jgi:hypothetical protein
MGAHNESVAAISVSQPDTSGSSKSSKGQIHLICHEIGRLSMLSFGCCIQTVTLQMCASLIPSWSNHLLPPLLLTPLPRYALNLPPTSLLFVTSLFLLSHSTNSGLNSQPLIFNNSSALSRNSSKPIFPCSANSFLVCSELALCSSIRLLTCARMLPSYASGSRKRREASSSSMRSRESGDGL